MGNGTGALASRRGDGPSESSMNRSAIYEPFGCEISEQQGRTELRPVTYRAKPSGCGNRGGSGLVYGLTRPPTSAQQTYRTEPRFLVEVSAHLSIRDAG